MKTTDPAGIPEDFPYREVLRKGKPRHGREDPFRLRHPKMEPGRRAKIFAPFDALKGFREALEAVRRETDPEQKDRGE